MVSIGVLDFQGSVEEHINSLKKIPNINIVKVKDVISLNKVNGLIIPGGESTTIGKLLDIFNITNILKEKIQTGLPIWGTCAGMILLAKKIIDENYTHLGVMDIDVRRNAYGRQIESFSEYALVSAVSNEPVKLVFIRAPWIEHIGNNVEILLKINNNIVAAREKNMLVTSFHPELTDNLSFHKYFISMCENNTNQIIRAD